MSIPGQPSYMPYSSPYGGAQYDYLGGYRSYMPPNPYAQNQPLNGQNNMLQNMQQPQQNNNIQFVLVPSRKVAEEVTVEKGQTVYMMNQNNPEIYMKAADMFGLQSIRYFKTNEFYPDQENQQNQNINQQNVDYIPRDEFNQFANAASNEIAALKQQIMSMSQQSIPIVETDIKPTTNTSTSTNTKKTTNTKESK